MNMQAVNHKHPVSVHQVENGKSKCGTPMTETWHEVDKPVTCAHCLGKTTGWKKEKAKYITGHFGVVSRGWSGET